MSDVGYQEYCEKCGAPVVWCKCLEDIDWSLEMRTHIGMEKLGQQVKELRAELARLTAELAEKGEYENKLVNTVDFMQTEIDRLTALVERLKEDAERLAEMASHSFEEMFGYENTPIELHRQLMKELEEK